MRVSTAPILDTEHAAKYLGVSPRTMEKWRYQGRGPTYIRPGGRRVVYKVDALDAYLHSVAV